MKVGRPFFWYTSLNLFSLQKFAKTNYFTKKVFFGSSLRFLASIEFYLQKLTCGVAAFRIWRKKILLRSFCRSQVKIRQLDHSAIPTPNYKPNFQNNDLFTLLSKAKRNHDARKATGKNGAYCFPKGNHNAQSAGCAKPEVERQGVETYRRLAKRTAIQNRCVSSIAPVLNGSGRQKIACS